MEGSKEIPEDQLYQMAEKAIKESKSGVGELMKNTFVDLLRTTHARSPKEKNTSNQHNFLTFEDYSNALKSIPIEQKLSIRFPN